MWKKHGKVASVPGSAASVSRSVDSGLYPVGESFRGLNSADDFSLPPLTHKRDLSAVKGAYIADDDGSDTSLEQKSSAISGSIMTGIPYWDSSTSRFASIFHLQ